MTITERTLDLPFMPRPGPQIADRAIGNASAREGGQAQAVAKTAAFLVNGDTYFRHLSEALSAARQSIWIIGWDFNPDILLEPEKSDETLGDRLHALVDANPMLEVRILVWALGPVYSGKSLRLLRRQQFPRNPRIQLQFHMHRDIRGSHHQKIVCIDDDRAYVGGIDLTARRWDTWRHRIRDALRRDPRGQSYDPLHDVQVTVTGDAAARLGDVARFRWLQATGEALPPVQVVPDGTPPAKSEPGCTALLSEIPVAVAITDLASGSREGVAATLDMIRRARRHLYIEAQYLASFRVAEALADRLQESDGPEVVIICTLSSHGFIEKMLMANNRDRIIRRLRQVDHHDRFRVYYPVVPVEAGAAEMVEVLVHSKLLIADDDCLRIGSSNLNNRSECMDSECDLILSAVTPDHRNAIRDLRDALLGEYFGVDGGVVTARMAEDGSLIGTIEALNTRPRGLRPFVVDPKGSITPVAGTSLLDPMPGG